MARWTRCNHCGYAQDNLLQDGQTDDQWQTTWDTHACVDDIGENDE
jgi:hypothetical protein